jgi:hypothetical protein
MNSGKWDIAGWGLGPAAGAGERDPAPGSSPLRPEAAPKMLAENGTADMAFEVAADFAV